LFFFLVVLLLLLFGLLLFSWPLAMDSNHTNTALVAVGAACAAGLSIQLLRCISVSFDQWCTFRTYSARVRFLFHTVPIGRALFRLVGGSAYLAPNGSDHSVSLEWVRRVISEQRSKDPDSPWPDPATIRSVTVEDGGLRGGFVGDMFRIKIVLDGSDTPFSLVVKTVKPVFGSRLSAALLGSAREALYYKYLVAPWMEKQLQQQKQQQATPSGDDEAQQMALLLPNSPRVLYADGSLAAGDFTVVMEDLGGSAVSCVPLLGNQCWGAPPAGLPDVEPVQLIERIFLEFARVHGSFWRRADILLQHSWLKYSALIRGADRARFEIGLASTCSKWQTIVGARGESAVVWPTEVVSAMTKAISNSNWAAFRKRFNLDDAHVAFTLCHGDFHAGNMMWADELKKLFSFDWSEVGFFCPFTELAQFVVSNMTIELRRAHEEQLFRAYYDRLIQTNPAIDTSIFTLEECYDRYKAGGIERWLQMLCILGAIHTRDPKSLPAPMLAWFVEQVRAFIADHEPTCKTPVIFMSSYCLAYI
jgi:hypothetical protein